MICVAIVFTIAFIVIVGGIFGIFWGMHETEENTAIVVSSSGRVKGSSTIHNTINQMTWVCSKMQHCATCSQIVIDQIYGFHVHLFVFSFVYQINSRIGILFHPLFAND